ncbi:MAG: hypothetical protein DRO99_03335 [Candidatus Aenigmatarchaeota archaeon]|nr:MAG: hypothetical protein DRO99_03335 [Candidatus Aenigmarchaeota archaeon]
MQSLPFFFIIVASTLKGIKKRYVYGLVLVIILLFIASWNGTGSTGVFKETNMGYSDFVLANADAIKYIEENHPNARILVDSDNRELFLSPDYGYVTSPKDIVVVHGLRDDPLQGFEIIYHTPRIDIPQSIDDINAFARRIGYIECEDGKIGDYVKNSMHYYLYEHDTVIIGIFERNGQRVEIRKPV